MALTKEAILSANDSKLVAVEVPEWGGTVYVRVMNGAERHSWITSLKDGEDSRVPLLVRSIADQNGKRLFDDSDTSLSTRNGVVLDRLAIVAAKINGLAADSTEDARKNSEAPQSY